ncbi:hypothetical protein VNO77_28722 [Canavalia gladiata]|uniref:GIR1-like zinc ribbon domain-containing protein n=1 Tax=Canavalia gladiata TaxID=3824 RepID=A0AAN9Q7X4_CANGL
MSEGVRNCSLEFGANLSLPPAENTAELSTSSSIGTCSSEGSCLSSDSEADEEMKVMVLVGCVQCLMYVLLSKADPNPKCPKCKSTALLHFLNNKQNANKRNR